MVNIVIENLEQKEMPVNEVNRTVLFNLQLAGVDWMQGCGGKGRCTTCKAIIVHGAEHLSNLTAAEERYRALGALAMNERLICQLKTSGNIVIRVPDEYKLPHLKYSE